jgi:type I restriction enzyme, S subunit
MSQVKALPKEWKWVKLGEVAEINPRIPNKESISDDFDVQFLPMKLVEELSGKIHLDEIKKYGEVKKGYTPFIENDVIFAKVTPCMENGKIALVKNLKNGIGFGSSEFHVVRSSKNLNSKFVFHFIIQEKFRREAQNEMTGAVGLRRVPKQFIENYVIPLPPLSIQAQIVEKLETLLSELDKGKAQLLTAQAQLKTYRQAVLKYAFEGKLTGKDVKEGELPKGWKWVTMKDVCTKIGDIDHKMPVQLETGYPYVSTKDFTNDLKISFEKAKYISEEDYLNLSRKIKPEKGDIIFPRYGTIGKNILIDFDKEFLVSYSCAVVKPNHDLVLSKYIYLYSLSPKITDEIKKYVVETTQANIGIASIKSFVFPLPPLSIQAQVVTEIERRLSVCDHLEGTIKTGLAQSETLRQSLLKQAFEGRLV